MPEHRAGPRERDVSRRDFLRKGLPGRIAGLLGGGATAASAATTAEAARSDPGDFFSPRDLTRMSLGDVSAALARIRARTSER